MKAEHPTPNIQHPTSNDGADALDDLECPFTIEWGRVTPKMAADWLADAAENRGLKKASIDAYSRDMLTGRWFPNHQGIAFRPDGKLFDGQNRLSAIVRSGRPQWMLVCRYKVLSIEGVESTPMQTFDRGVARSVGDVLGLEHGMKEEGKAVAAALLQIARLCVKFPRFQAHKCSAPQAVAVLELFRPQMEWLVKVRTATWGLRRVELVGSLAFAHALMPVAAADFYEQVIAGNGSSGAPSRILHGALTEDRVGLSDWSQRSAATERQRSGGLVLALLRAHVAGEKLPGLPFDQAMPALGWFQEQMRAKVLQVAALFPMLKDDEVVVKVPRAKKREPSVEAPRATRAFTEAPDFKFTARQRAKEPEPAPVPVVKPDRDLRRTPAAARLLAAAGGAR